MSKKSQQKEKQHWAEEKANARRCTKAERILIGKTKEFNETLENSLTQFELHMDSAMPCKLRKTSANSSSKAPKDPQERERIRDWQRHGEILSKDHNKQNKAVFTCICEAHESTRKRIPETQNKDHEDHIAEVVVNSMSHPNVVHKHNPTLPVVDKEWEMLKNLPAWQESKVKTEQEVIEQAQKESKTIHFTTLVGLCHLKKLRMVQEVPNI